MSELQRCGWPGCKRQEDPRWGGWCDGHGVSTDEEFYARRDATETRIAYLEEQNRLWSESHSDICAHSNQRIADLETQLAEAEAFIAAVRTIANDPALDVGETFRAIDDLLIRSGRE